MGIGDWGLGIGDWGLGPIPNPQSPIPIFISLLYSIKKGNEARDSSQYEETMQNQKQKSPLLNLNSKWKY